jgi:signal transduction histidine kinase
VIAATLLSIVSTSYFELDEWLYSHTRRWELFQIDELPVTFIVLVLGLMWYSRRRHRQTRRELAARRQAEQNLERALAANRELAEQHIRMQESERKHLARELHDELGQYLNAIKLDAVAIRDGGAGAPPASRAAGAIIQSVDHVHGAVSDMIRRLRPVGLDELGLAAAVESCVDQWRARLPGTRFVLAFGGQIDSLGEHLNLTLYRLIQEGLTNCSRHADARHLEISLRRGIAAGGDEVTLRVQDDGRGADLAHTSGFGLSGMRERVEMLGGRFVVASEPGAGLRFEAHLPVARVPA